MSCLRLSQSGHTQQYIADQLGITQSAVSLILTKYQRNTTKDARQILEAKAADMALNVAKNGRPADQLRALEGLSVIDLREKQQPGLFITINGFALSGMGLTFASQDIAVSPVMHSLTEAHASDNSSYVNQTNPLIEGSLAPQLLEDQHVSQQDADQGQPGAGIAEGPTPDGGG